MNPHQPCITAHLSPDQVQVANNQQTYIRVANCQTVRMKEEKEVLEHFAGVFTMMNPLTFKEIFQTTVPYMVERISKNYALQVHAVSHRDKKCIISFLISHYYASQYVTVPTERHSAASHHSGLT